MSKKEDKTSDAARSDPAVADRNREELAKEAARGLKEAVRHGYREKTDARIEGAPVPRSRWQCDQSMG